METINGVSMFWERGLYYVVWVSTPKAGCTFVAECGEDNYQYTRNLCDWVLDSGTYKFRVKTTTDKTDRDFDAGKVTECIRFQLHEQMAFASMRSYGHRILK